MKKKKKLPRALLADPCEIRRTELRKLVTDLYGTSEIDEVVDGYEAVLLSDDTTYDLLFVSSQLPRPELWKAVRRIRELNPDSEIFLLASPEEEIEVMNAIEFGVRKILSYPLEGGG